MTKKFLFIAAFTALLTLVAACSKGPGKIQDKSKNREVVTEVFYTCSMHPEIHSAQPGKCPKCGMELIRKESAITDSTLTQTPDSLVQK